MPVKKSNDTFILEMKQKNPTIIPLETYINSTTGIRCKCTVCGYEWLGIPNNMLRGEGCQKCAGNQKLTQEEFVEKAKKANPELSITGTYINSKTKIAFMCNICGERHSAAPSSILRGHGCRKCAREKSIKSRLLSTDDFIRKLTQKRPDFELKGSYTGMKNPTAFMCRTCGLVFNTTPDSIMHGRQCDHCRFYMPRDKKTNKPLRRHPLMKSHETFVNDVHQINPDITVIDQYQGANRKIHFQCAICDNIWETRPEQILRGQHCPECQKRWSTSFPEQAVFYYLKQVYPDAINTYRNGFYRSELDIYLPSIKTGIEYDGRNWHKNKLNLEKKKYVICKENGIHLIRIRERITGDEKGSICDHCIVSQHGDKKHFRDLDHCINALLKHLSVDQKNIDTKRDQNNIKEQYYKALKDRSLGSLYPELAKEWYQLANGKITPFMLKPQSNEHYYWKCQQCGYIYQAYISNRTRGHACPKCANVLKRTEKQYIDELQIKQPDITLIGHYTDSTTSTEFQCKICGNIWVSKPHVLLKRSPGCPHCKQKAAGRKKALEEYVFYERAAELYPSIEFSGAYTNNNSIIQCICRKCGNQWHSKAGTIMAKNTGCANCSNRKPKKVLCVDTSEIYTSIQEAAKKTGISHVVISRCCNNKQNTAGKLRWSFI